MATVNFERLSRLPALQGLTEAELSTFFKIPTKHVLQPGDVFLKTGDPADCFFLVASGQVEIRLPGAKGGPATPLATLGPGNLVGEMPLLYAQPLRQADAVAATEAILLRFSYDDFRHMADEHVELGKKFRSNLGKIVANRVWSTLPAEPKTGTKQIEEAKPQAAQNPSAMEAMRKASIFMGLTEDEFSALQAIAIPVHVPTGAPIVRMGDPSDSFYLVTHGHCEVVIPKDGQALAVARFGPGQVFGEMALVYEQPNRTADVLAVDDVKLLNFSFEDYRRLVGAAPAIGRKLRNNLGRVAASRSWTLQNDATATMKQRSGG